MGNFGLHSHLMGISQKLKLVVIRQKQSHGVVKDCKSKYTYLFFQHIHAIVFFQERVNMCIETS